MFVEWLARVEVAKPLSSDYASRAIGRAVFAPMITIADDPPTRLSGFNVIKPCLGLVEPFAFSFGHLDLGLYLTLEVCNAVKPLRVKGLRSVVAMPTGVGIYWVHGKQHINKRLRNPTWTDN